MGGFFYASQDAEKVRQRRSRVAQTLNVPQRVRFGPSLAGPCWTVFLSILLNVKRMDVL
jgi:hypothetical protein